MKSTVSAVVVGILCLTGCGNDSRTSVEPSTGIQEDRQAQSGTDELTAPTRPRLEISAAPETLILKWQHTHPDQVARIHVYNTLTGEQTLISGDMTADQLSLALPSSTPWRAWQAEQFRLELCIATECVSSDPVAVDTLVDATIQTLRPAVFIKGEKFAEAVAANINASVVATTLPAMGAVQVHFRVAENWYSNDPIRITIDDSQLLQTVAMSDSGDTLAVLLAGIDNNTPSNQIRIIERLGESWMITDTILTPRAAFNQSPDIFQLSPDGDKLLTSTADALVIYQRSTDWLQHSAVMAQSDGDLIAASMNDAFTVLHTIERHMGALWLVLYRSDPADPTHTWRAIDRLSLQDLIHVDDMLLQSSGDGNSLIVAGWEQSDLTHQTPVARRYAMSAVMNERESDSDVTGNSWYLLDSIKLEATDQADALLRFSADRMLDSLAIGWQSRSNDDAQIVTFTYDPIQQNWYSGLQLPANLPRLAKHGFASDMQMSRDGDTLLLAAPPGSAQPTHALGGELMIFR